MELSALTSISPVDGRYRNQTAELAQYFSEYALIRYRILVEIEYFISLCELPLPQLKEIKKEQIKKIKDIYLNFTPTEALKIKETEKTTNHDVKAVEYYLKEKFSKLGLSKYSEFVHFGLTSQDINNTAIPLSLKEAYKHCLLPLFDSLIKKLEELIRSWNQIPMLARTHGQPPNNFSMVIYDRWGNLVFQTNKWYIKHDDEGYAEGWKGTLNNTGSWGNVVMDVYVYRIKLTDLNGLKHEYYGRITAAP